jgi:regulator of CtrA degradation
MTDPMTLTLASDAGAGATRRILDFARSEVFERTFREGMVLVEETAAYLDGPGRAASKRLDRIAALAYAGESMRLTTRLMQVASWLLVQRAVREGEMTLSEASSDKYRFTDRDRADLPGFNGVTTLPETLKGLMSRCEMLYDRVRRIDESMYAAHAAEPPPNQVTSQMARLRAVFGDGDR